MMLSVPLASSLTSNPLSTTVDATRPKRTSARLPERSGRREAEGPCGFTCNGSVVSYVSPAAGAAASLRHRPVGYDGTHPLVTSTGIATRISTARRTRQQARACPVVASEMVLLLAGRAGCDSASKFDRGQTTLILLK
jgi:hypothetical protein